VEDRAAELGLRLEAGPQALTPGSLAVVLAAADGACKPLEAARESPPAEDDPGPCKESS
jgi:hypothetical protein